MDNSDPSPDSDSYHGTHEAGGAEHGDEAETYRGTHEGSGSEAHGSQADEDASLEEQAEPE
jgi:hypothetical protein